MKHNYVNIIIQNLPNYTPLNYDDLHQLFIKFHNGDLSAKEKIITSNLRLVLTVIGRIHVTPDDVEDMFQVGCIGLIKAVNGFDLSYNTKFSTYAIPHIIGAIKNYRRGNQMISGLRKEREMLFKVTETEDILEASLGRGLTLGEISKALGVDEKIISEVINAYQEPISFYTVIGDSSDNKNTYLLDTIESDKNNSNMIDDRVIIDEASKFLNDKERRFLYYRYMLDQTQIKAGQKAGCPSTNASKLEKTILKKMKSHIKYRD